MRFNHHINVPPPCSQTLSSAVISSSNRLQAPALGRVDWATAELLAMGSLVEEGCVVRLDGQDCGRGT